MPDDYTINIRVVENGILLSEIEENFNEGSSLDIVNRDHVFKDVTELTNFIQNTISGKVDNHLSEKIARSK